MFRPNTLTSFRPSIEWLKAMPLALCWIAINFVVAATVHHIRANGGNTAIAHRAAKQISEVVRKQIGFQWSRQPMPTDIPVPSHGQ